MQARITVLLAAIGIGTLGVVPSVAEEAKSPAPLSLQDSIQVALQNQIDVTLGRNDVQASKEAVKQAVSTYYPQIALKNNAFRFGSRGVLEEAKTGTALTATQVIFDSGLRETAVKGAKYGVTESTARFARTLQTVTFDVTQNYYQVLRAKKLADVAKASVDYNEGYLKLIQARIDAGDAAKVDVLPVQSQLANAKVTLLAAENDIRTAKVQLQNSMGLAPTADFDIQDVTRVPEPLIESPETYVTTALKQRPDVLQSSASVAVAKQDVKASRITLYPRVAISGEYQHGVGNLSGDSAQILGGITYDIFNGGRNRATYKKALLKESDATEQMNQVAKDIQAQVQNAYLNLTSARQRVTASSVGKDAAQQNYDVQNEKYKQGLAITLDLLNAEVQLVKAQSDYVQAQYDYYTAIAQLDYAVGTIGGNNVK